MRHATSAFLAVILLTLAESSGSAEPPVAIVTEEFMVDADTPGVQLYVRNKHPKDMSQVPAEHVVLYVHGATQPSEATFDLPVEGASWMDYIASRGWDVYLMDARGYGGSTRSPELVQPDALVAPVVSTGMKVRDAGSVVDFILKRRNVSRIALLGWSWGTIVTAAYAADHPDKVSRLVLYAPVWCYVSCGFDPQLRSASDVNEADPRPIVQATMAQMRQRLQSGTPPGRASEMLSEETFAAWSATALATDPVGALESPPVLRVPAGVSHDSQKFWDAGKSYYDPEKVVAPTLVIVAEWDELTPPDGAEALHEALANSPDRRFAQLDEGSHVIMLEKNRMSLFQAVQQFLDASGPPNE